LLYHIATSPFTFKMETFILLNGSNKLNHQRLKKVSSKHRKMPSSELINLQNKSFFLSRR
jgi:hypothetical protein